MQDPEPFMRLDWRSLGTFSSSGRWPIIIRPSGKRQAIRAIRSSGNKESWFSLLSQEQD